MSTGYQQAVLTSSQQASYGSEDTQNGRIKSVNWESQSEMPGHFVVDDALELLELESRAATRPRRDKHAGKRRKLLFIKRL